MGNSEFCFPRISMFLGEILGKQNSLFPSGPVIKCLLFIVEDYETWALPLVASLRFCFVHQFMFYWYEMVLHT